MNNDSFQLQVLLEKALPRVYRLTNNLFVSAFYLQKLVVGLQITRDAVKTGQIDEHTTAMFDTSSGTLAYGLALASRVVYGLPTVFFADPAISPTQRNLLELLGAKVEIVERPDESASYQTERLRALKKYADAHGNSFWARQYDNPSNPRAYEEIVAPYLLDQTPKIDVLIAAVGSGGAISGLTRGLRRVNPALKTIAVDAYNSVLFGLKDGPRKLRGLGNSLRPKCLDHTLVDAVYWVSAADAFAATNELYREYGLDLGATSGAAYLVAKIVARENPEKKILFVGPDRAERYLDTVYDETWRRNNGVYVERTPDCARETDDLDSVFERPGKLTRFLWARRRFEDVRPRFKYQTADSILQSF